MLLVLSITFNCHYTICGCMRSTGQFQFRWLKGYIYSSCYHQHQSKVSNFPIVIIFFRGCVPEVFVTSYSVTYCIHISGKPGFCFHYYWVVYDSANNRICFGLQIAFVCLYITHLIIITVQTYLKILKYQMPVRYIFSSVWIRLSIFSQLSIIQYVVLCIFSLTSSLVMIERMYIICLIVIMKSEVWTIIHCLGLGPETMLCAVCLSIFLC